MGLLLLGEKMLLQGWSGVALLVTGIALVATDPGEKVEEGPVTADMAETGPPPLIIWIGPALLCASAYALYNVRTENHVYLLILPKAPSDTLFVHLSQIFIKKGSASINPILGGVILQFVAAIYGSLLLGSFIVERGGPDFLTASPLGFLWASCAGIAVGTAELLSFCVSGMGVDASKSIPIIIGGR
jgi:drug/metabolite transporter (DMT)-like permease